MLIRNILVASALLWSIGANAQTLGDKPSQTEAIGMARANLAAAGCISDSVIKLTNFVAVKTAVDTIKVGGGTFEVKCKKWKLGFPAPSTPIPVVTKSTISWKAPTTRTDGAVLKPTEIKDYTVFLSNGYVTITTATSITLTGLAPGNYQVWVSVRDTNDISSALSPKVNFTIN